MFGINKRPCPFIGPSSGKTDEPRIFVENYRKTGIPTSSEKKTELLLDAYFSATKIKWILDKNEPKKGKLCFGTVDSWLVWKLTHGRVHVTDVSNASRTMLFNIHTQKWDKELLTLFGIPESMLPEVKASSEKTRLLKNVPIK